MDSRRLYDLKSADAAAGRRTRPFRARGSRDAAAAGDGDAYIIITTLGRQVQLYPGTVWL